MPAYQLVGKWPAQGGLINPEPLRKAEAASCLNTPRRSRPHELTMGLQLK